MWFYSRSAPSDYPIMNLFWLNWALAHCGIWFLWLRLYWQQIKSSNRFVIKLFGWSLQDAHQHLLNSGSDIREKGEHYSCSESSYSDASNFKTKHTGDVDFNPQLFDLAGQFLGHSSQSIFPKYKPDGVFWNGSTTLPIGEPFSIDYVDTVWKFFIQLTFHWTADAWCDRHLCCSPHPDLSNFSWRTDSLEISTGYRFWPAKYSIYFAFPSCLFIKHFSFGVVLIEINGFRIVCFEIDDWKTW